MRSDRRDSASELAEVVPEFAPLLRQASTPAGAGAHRRGRRSARRNRRRTLLVRIGAERGGRADRRVRRDLRRHHRAAIGPAQGRLGRRGAAHRARDQEPADADPALRRTPEAPLRARDHLRSRDLRAMRRHHHPPCRRYRPHGRRVLRLRAHAAAGDQAARTSGASRARRWCCRRPRRPKIAWTTDIPERGPIAPCDRRLIRQALTNLLQNAADAVAMRPERAGRRRHHAGGAPGRRPRC